MRFYEYGKRTRIFLHNINVNIEISLCIKTAHIKCTVIASQRQKPIVPSRLQRLCNNDDALNEH